MKRAINLSKHKIDFEDAALIFAGPTVTVEDDRFDYSETRYLTIGLLDGVPVSIIHTESTNEIRIISIRRATAREEGHFFRAAGFQHG